MFFRTPRFIRRWIRARMHPMAERTAMSVRQKISIVYMLIAWNAFGYVVYQMANGNKHWPVTHGVMSEEEAMERPASHWARTLGFKKVSVYRIGRHGISEKEDVIIGDDGEKTVPMRTGDVSGTNNEQI